MASSNAFLPDTAADLVKLLHLIPHPEGGFFLETHRSRSLAMNSRGQTDTSDTHLVTWTPPSTAVIGTPVSLQRNALTSIFWLPTVKSPMQPLTQNISDHVHYYQGGLPFLYMTFDPLTGILERYILGPDIKQGHVLQVPVPSGLWKCGSLQIETNTDNDGQDPKPHYQEKIFADYSLIAEAVGPGFDFHDFRFVDKSEVDGLTTVTDEIRQILRNHLHVAPATAQEIDEHYTSEEAQTDRAKERM